MQSTFSITSRPNTLASCLHPMLYKFLRQDESYTDLVNSGGFIRFEISALSTEHEVGDSIMLRYQRDGVESIAFTTITAINPGVIGISPTVIDTALSGAGFTENDSATPFFNNLTQRPGFTFRIGLYDAVTNERLFEDDFDFTPNSSGVCSADVQFLKDLMNPEIVLADVNTSEQDTNRFKLYYIKWTPTWIGSAESETDDVANGRIAMWTGIQIQTGRENDVMDVAPNWVSNPGDPIGGWLTQFDRLTLFVGRYFDIAYWAAAPFQMVVERFMNGVLQSSTVLSVQAYISRLRVEQEGDEDEIHVAPMRGLGEILPPDTDWVDLALPTQPFDSKTATSLIGNIDGSGPNPNKGAAQLLAMPVPLPSVAFNYEVDITGTMDSGSEFRVRIQIIASGTVLYTYTSDPFQGSDFPGPIEDTADLQPTGNTGTVTAITVTLLPQTTDPGDNFDVEIILPIGEVLTYDIITAGRKIIDVVTPCDPSVHLGWMNILGGQDWWSFQHNQDENLSFNGDQRAERKMLYAEDLTIEVARILNRVNTVKEVYRPAIAELTTSTFTNKKRLGQQVYDVTDEDAVRGVIVIPRSNTIRSRDKKTVTSVEIEYPDDSVQ